MSLGTYIKEKRQESGMSQKDLAEHLAGYGFRYNSSTIGWWERELTHAPTHDPKFFEAVAKIFNVRTVDVLAGAGYDVVEEVTLTDKEAIILDAYRRGDFKEAMRLFARD